MAERIVAEQLSRFGCVRVTISLTDASIQVERWKRSPPKTATATLDMEDLDALRAWAKAVRQDEQALVRGDFYADGEERLRVELTDHEVEIHNDTDQIRSARAMRSPCCAFATISPTACSARDG